ASHFDYSRSQQISPALRRLGLNLAEAAALTITSLIVLQLPSMAGNHRRERISSSDCGGRREERRARFGDRQVGQGEGGNNVRSWAAWKTGRACFYESDTRASREWVR